jgi:hypothetical protein
MIVEPYKRIPKKPRLALINDDGVYVDETGAIFNSTSDYKFKRGEIVCYALWDTAISLTQRGIGEFQRWNGKDVRYRTELHLDENEWKIRPLDAGIIQFPVSIDLPFDEVLKQLVEFRDWLDDEGSKAQCTFGSIAISLLKAKIDRRIITGLGGGQNSPPIEFTRGGRQYLPPGGSGRFDGSISNWDLPAAYASTIGNINWDGYWCQCPYKHAVKAYNRGLPVYVHATVEIPSLTVGPLPINHTHPPNPLSTAIHHIHGYPVDKKLEGIWTLNELLSAEEAGCKFTPLICWTMMTDKQPFLPWWSAIKTGRQLSGPISRALAKRTGNALWGTFCRDGNQKGKKIAVHYDNGKRKVRRLNYRNNTQPAGHDLAEAISSSVRAKLYQHILAADTHLLSAHTDGMWVQGKYTVPDGWRIKQEAQRIDLLDPQNLRYYISANNSRVVMSGVPYKLAPEKFEERWERFEHYNSNPDDLPDVRKSSGNTRRIFRYPTPPNQE